MNINETITALQHENEQLRHELTTITNANKATLRQEADALRTQISRAIKLPYHDYLTAKQEGCNADNYNCLLADLKQIFISLRRLGINGITEL